MGKSRERKQQPAQAPAPARRHWSAHEKARIVRRHLRDGVTVADLAEQTGAAPGLIHTWIKLSLERLDTVLDDRRSQAVEQQQARLLAKKDARIRRLEGVVVELSTEVLTLKNGDGAS